MVLCVNGWGSVVHCQPVCQLNMASSLIIYEDAYIIIKGYIRKRS